MPTKLKPRLVTNPQAAELLGVSRAVVRDLLLASGVPPHGSTAGHWPAAAVERLAARAPEDVAQARVLTPWSAADELTPPKRQRARRGAASGAPSAATVDASSATPSRSRPAAPTPAVPPLPRPRRAVRGDELQRVVAHLGPTNSGKTHAALRELVARAQTGEHGPFVYAAPLRMIAQEAFEALSRELGAEHVGLITGEERIRPDAQVLCTTTEKAPMHGEMLCLDEVQWCADTSRGSTWAQLMLHGDYREMHLAGAADALPVLRSVFEDRLEVRRYDRLVPLRFIGRVPVGEAVRSPRRTIVIAFRRAAVLAVAGALQQQAPERPTAVLYGAMPLAARREQLRRVRDDEVDLVVSSDVLGHGVNLPCDRVLFAETVKFDGRDLRSLLGHEVAQIAGRAGRFGLSEIGEVGVLDGLGFLHPDPAVVEAGLAPRHVVEGIDAHRRIDAVMQAPGLDDLDCDRPEQLPQALADWAAEMRLRPRAGVVFADPQPMLDRLRFMDAVLADLGGGLADLHLDDAWSIARSPLAPGPPAYKEVYRDIAAAFADDAPAFRPDPRSYDAIGDLGALDHAARYLEGLRWASATFPQLRHDDELIARCERLVAGQFEGFFDDLRSSAVGRCGRCGRPGSPLDRYCPSCHGLFKQRRRAERRGSVPGPAVAGRRR